jgi:hypothetical protein
MHATVDTEADVARPAQSLVLSALNTGVERPPPEPPPPDSCADDYFSITMPCWSAFLTKIGMRLLNSI